MRNEGSIFHRYPVIIGVLIVCFAVFILHNDLLGSVVGVARTPRDSPCECLTGVFADASMSTALRQSSRALVGIHWRTPPESVVGFFDPWEVKYANCIAVHELPRDLFASPVEVVETAAAADVLRRRLEADAARSADMSAWQWQRQRRGRGRGSDGVSAEGAPMCHVWLIPETRRLPAAGWAALRALLGDGDTAGGEPLRLPGAGREHYYPLGVVLWADPASREELMKMVPPRTVMMFTTIRG